MFCIAIYANSDDTPIALEKVSINASDKAAVMRGAKFFAANCMVCHTMKYLQYNKVARKAGITLDKMPLKNKEWWLGIAPPDLTLIARVHGPDWLFTYFNSFYKDPSRPTGYNNLISKNNVMTNIFATLQGVQELTPAGKEYLEHPGWRKKHYYNILELVRRGSMTPAEFDTTMKDLVTFLVYASDPGKPQREDVGWWILGFFAVFFILAWLLKRAYWKKVK